MGGVNLSVHPLFFALGFYYAITGGIFIFIVYTLSALIHELGHSFVANGLGYKLDKITLMPYGAVVKGDIDGLNFSDQIKIALAGPIINLAVGLFFVALWWVYPESYAYTDVVAQANFTLATVNFLPVFPLDGGRVLSAFFAKRTSLKVSNVICKCTGAVFALFLGVCFFLSLKNGFNPSLLFFSLFVVFGAFGSGAKNKYVKAYTTATISRLKKGMAVKRQALSQESTIKKLISVLDESAYNEILVCDESGVIATLSQAKICKIIEKGDVYSKIGKYLSDA